MGYLEALRQGVQDESPLDLTEDQIDAIINALPNTLLIQMIDCIDERNIKGF